MNLSNDIRVYFASEAWNLFQSYIESLQEVMERKNINSEKQDEVIEGIIDYVDEYYEELNVEKLTYSTTLNLLKDLGSPSEALFAMDLLSNEIENSTIRNSHSLTINCRRCNTQIPQNSRYCEICGTLTSEVRTFRSTVSQRVIDHLYISIFLCTYFIFVSSGVINWMILYSSELTDPDSMLVLYSILISPTIIIGAGIIALMLGIFLNLFLQDLKSDAYKIKKLVNSLEDTFAVALILIALTVLLLDVLLSGIMFINTNRGVELFFFLFLLIGEGALIILGLWNYMVRPEDPDLYSLLKTKKIIHRRIKGSIIQLNLIILFTCLLAISIIPNFIIQNLSHKWTQYAHWIGVIFSLAVFFFGNGVYFLYFYSWPYLKRLKLRKMSKV